MDEPIYKRHNKTLLLYHLVFSLKYRRGALNNFCGAIFKNICIEISDRHEIQFLEIGYESDHVHFLVQGVPTMSVSKLVTLLKSLTARELFKRYPEIKQMLCGGNFWTSGYYANTVGQYGNTEVIKQYIENQGKKSEYQKIYSEQLKLF